jgi:hypothetical protein
MSELPVLITLFLSAFLIHLFEIADLLREGEI